jgi:hypothetical protein
MRWRLACTLCLITLANGQTVSVPRYADADALLVYKAVIPSSSRFSVLMVNSTVEPTQCTPSEKDMPDAQFREALDAFHRANSQKWNLSGLLNDQKLITETELDSIFKSGPIEGWKEFHNQHPKFRGYMRASAVGFNSAHTIAILYTEAFCNAKCGSGAFSYFRRTPNGWSRVTVDIPNCRWIE